ncbi:hypothetical protein [Deinococcus yavapaiensis]|uniref:Helix-turn-helix protein n=1 Tax=Deinococcus yavapaiensis KR-236 TaxID=694435 RepID=A0A318S263_9DEIO|nr:hypothetical protein [Deinococcus yavapaiensis]PYE51917.1 hypothetical protein DES52_114118 [Deinococcus yavapaiensis KR-236]
MAFVASTPLQARLLLDLSNASLLSLLMASERNASSLAAELAVDVRKVHYKLTRLCEGGLIGVTREEKRAGRPVKYYEAFDRAYHVPFSLTDAATLRELLGALYTPFSSGALDSMASGLARREAHTLSLTLNQNGLLQLGFDARPSETHFSTWGAFALTDEQAVTLRARLFALYEEYRALSPREGARSYFVGLTITPGELQS